MDISERIGFRLTGFSDWNIEDTFSSLSENGFKAVELCLEHPDLNPGSLIFYNSHKILDILYKFDLIASAVSYHGKNSSWEDKKRLCLYGIELAVDLGMDVFISGSHTDMESYPKMLKFTGEMCEIARKKGVYFAIEPEPGTVIEGSREMRRLIDEAASPALKVNLDIGHSFITSENYLNDLLSWKDYIVHVHIDDIKDKIHEHLSPGMGDIDFKRVFYLLDEIDYRGYYIIDLFNIRNNPALYAKKSIRDLKRKLQSND